MGNCMLIHPGNIMVLKDNPHFYYTHVNGDLIFYSKKYRHEGYTIDIKEMIYLGIQKDYKQKTLFLYKHNILNCYYFFGKDQDVILKDWVIYGN